MADHGHGHEKAGGHGHEGGKHGAWMEHAKNALKATLFGVLAYTIAPPLLACYGIIMPPYLAGAAGAAGYLTNTYNKGADKHGGGHH